MARRRAAGKRPAQAAAAPPPRADRVTVAAGACVVAAALALYAASAARDIVFGDTPELTTAALTLGVPHPPGYPLFTTLGWLFGQIPLGAPPFRVALLSAVCHAATTGIVYAAAWRFSGSVMGAVVAAVALATAPLFWAWSLVGEVFPLNGVLAATMLLLVALWHERPERDRLLVAGALTGGLALTAHQTSVLLAPAVLYVLWRRRERVLRSGALVARAAGAFVVGLLPYAGLLLLAAREPAWSWGDLRSAGELVAHVLRERYGTGALVNEPGFVGGSALTRVVALLLSFDPLQWALIAAGAVYAWRVRRWYATYLLLAFAFSGPAFAAYANINLNDPASRPLLESVLQRFFLLPHVTLAPLAAFAVPGAAAFAKGLGLSHRSVPSAVAAAAVLAAAAIVAVSYRDVDQSRNDVARRYASDVLASLKPNSIFLGGADAVVFPIVYLQAIERARPDVTLVALPLITEDWYIRDLRRRHPELALAADRYGPRGTPFRSFLDANRSRPIAIVGDLPDQSARSAYWLYRRGLTHEVRPLAETVTLEQMVAENEPLLASYRPPTKDEVRSPYRVWERQALVDHARAHYKVGEDHEVAANGLRASAPSEAARGYATARAWYERALRIDPDLAEAKAGLARLPR